MMSDTVWQYKPDRPTDTPTGLLFTTRSTKFLLAAVQSNSTFLEAMKVILIFVLSII